MLLLIIFVLFVAKIWFWIWLLTSPSRGMSYIIADGVRQALPPPPAPMPYQPPLRREPVPVDIDDEIRRIVADYSRARH